MSNWDIWLNGITEDWKVVLVTENHIFYRNNKYSCDPKSCVRLYTRKMDLVATGIKAFDLFRDTLGEIYEQQIVVSYMHSSVAQDIAYMEKNGKFNKLTIREIVNKLGLSELICTSFDVARHNGRRKNIVIIGETDVYLTYKYNDKFGEFVCWVEDEFKEDASVYESLRGTLRDYYSLSEKEMDEKIERKEFFFDFKPYDN